MTIFATQPGPDGCSGGISRIWRLAAGKRPTFEWCCDEHDLAYDEGGGPEDRRLADQRFRDCVAESGHPWAARGMWAFVRLFGWMFWGE